MAIFSWFIVFSICGIVSTETYQCDEGTIYPERGTQVVVDCGVQGNHIAVFWYRDSVDNNDPFLRLENGGKTEPDGFRIQDNGAMVIINADISHDGLYVNRVVDNAGQSRDTEVTIEVKVSLASEPVIVDCSSTVNDVCESVEESKRESTLICIAGPAKPALTISWDSFDGTEQQSVNSNAQNDSTSLYTSTSLLEYNSNNFLLEYFNCNVNDETVDRTITTAMFIKGKQNVEVKTQEIQYIISGADLTLNCPLERSDSLGEWGITFPNNTYHPLWRVYPGFEGGHCADANDCEVLSNGNLHITKVTYINEGRYVCIYTDTVSEGVLEIPVEVHVSPEPLQTVIKGCQDTDPCKLNVANSGSLECSIFGSRPSIKPEVTVDTNFNPVDVFIFGEEFESVEGALPGTFDTVLRFQYEIPECSDVVKIDCIAGENTHTDEVMKTMVNLVTATRGCDEGNGRPGLIVFLVFFFLLLFLGIVLFVFKRKYIMYKVRNLIGGKTKDNELPDVEQSYMLTPANEHTARHRHQVEPITDVKNKVIPEDETERLQKIFDDKFQPIYLAITEKEAKYEDFNKMMDSFSVENKVTVPLPYLAEFLKSKSKPMADVLKVLKFVIEHFKNQWVGYFLKMLDDLLQTNQVTATNYITLIGSLVQKRVIELSRYVELTGAFLSNNTASLDIILAELKNLIDRRYCSKEDFSNTFLRYYLGNYITDEDVLKELSAETESFQFVPTYFLQSVYLEFQEKNETKVLGKLSVIFKKVFEQLMQPSKQTPASVSEDEKTNKTENQNIATNLEVGKERFNESDNSLLLNVSEPIKEASVPGEVKEETKGEGNPEAMKNDETEKPSENESSPLMSPSETEKKKTVPDENIDKTNEIEKQQTVDINKEKVQKEMRDALIRAILFAVDCRQISTDECVDMMKAAKLSEVEIEGFMSSYIDNKQAAADNSRSLLKQTLTEKMISDKTYLKLFWPYVTHRREVTFEEFMDHFKTLLQDKLVSERCFEQKLTDFIKGGRIEQKEQSKEVKKQKKSKKKNIPEINYYSNYWDSNEWIKFVTGLAVDSNRGNKNLHGTKETDVMSETVIGNSLRLTLFQCVVSTYKLKKGEIEDVMKKQSINEKDRKLLLKNIKFPGIFGR